MQAPHPPPETLKGMATVQDPLIVEQYTRAKTGLEKDNEDAIAQSSDGKLIAIIDGMTNAEGAQLGSTTPGRYAAQTLANHIRANDSTMTFAQACEAWQHALKEARKIAASTHALSAEQTRMGAFIVAYNHTQGEVWRLGDSHVRINDTQYLGSKEIDVVTSDFRAAYNYARLAAGDSPEALRAQDPGREAAKALYRAQGHLANHDGPYGYGVLDGGRPIPARYQEIWPLPARATVILCSDGYPSVQATWSEAETELDRLIKEDPLGLQQLRYMGKATRPENTHPDDRSYVRIAHVS